MGSPPELDVCHACDWVMRLPDLREGESACCPRCGTTVRTGGTHDPQVGMAWSLSALLMLGLSLHFRFLTFETRGVSQSITLFETATALFREQYAFLAGLVALTTVILPAVFLLCVFYLNLSLELDVPLPDAHRLSHVMGLIEPWMMSDVFLVGVLVGLIKIASMATIQVGPSFFAFGAYMVLFLVVVMDFEPSRYWEHFEGDVGAVRDLEPGRPAHVQDVTGCVHCGLAFPSGTLNTCPRCGHWHPLSLVDRWQLTLALLVTAAVLYVPAHTLPIMHTETLAGTEASTIVEGVLELYRTGSWPIALIIFVASVVVPLAKILALGWLCYRSRFGTTAEPDRQVWLYRVTEWIGRWSMIDVFVVALLVALVQAGGFITVHPGPAAISFALVVLVTMLAALTFHARWIWHRPGTVRRSYRG